MLRTAFCPRCGADFALDEGSLIYKRAACAACGSEVELTRELFGRTRKAAPVPAKGLTGFARIDPPPSRRLAVRPDGRLVLRRPFWRVGFYWVLMLGVFLVLPLAYAYPWALAAALIALLLVGIGPRVELAVEGDALIVKTGALWRRTMRVPLSIIGDIRVVETHVRVARACEYPLELGDGFFLEADDVRWTARHLTHAVRRARLGKKDAP